LVIVRVLTAVDPISTVPKFRSPDIAMMRVENVQPVGDVGGVVLTRLKRQIKIGTEERGAEFGHEFFDRVAFGPKRVVPKSRAKRDSCAVQCVVSCARVA
jgi:hypothetical protein